jgi:hypothetical protein
LGINKILASEKSPLKIILPSYTLSLIILVGSHANSLISGGAWVGVGDGVGVSVGVGVLVGSGVCVLVGVSDGVGVSVEACVGVLVGVGVGVGVGFGKILSKIGLHPAAKVPNPKSFRKSLLLIFPVTIPYELILFLYHFLI